MRLPGCAGDKNSAAYKTGQGASYVPWKPASALKSLGIGTLKIGGRSSVKKRSRRTPTTWLEQAAAAGVREAYLMGFQSRRRSGGGPHNGPGPAGEKIAKTFRSASYTERVLEQDTYLYSAWGDESPDMSRYWSADPPAGPLQAKTDSALPPGNSAENVTVVRVPAGTKVYEGSVAPDFGRTGGGSQVVVEGSPRGC